MTLVPPAGPVPVVLCVPQWQGSGRVDARSLAAGARATADLVPRARRVDAAVSEEPGTQSDGVAHLDVLARNLAAIRAAVAGLGDAPAFTAGGDCGVEVAPVEAALERHGDALTVLWLDAHGDLNTPRSSPSGAFHGMVLRTLLGDGPRALAPRRTLDAARLVLAGVRALDPAEAETIGASGIRRIGVAQIERIADIPGPLYVHVDLDVLDPASFGGISYPEPSGVPAPRLIAALSRLSGVVGASVVEHAPAAGESPRDVETLRALIEALMSAMRPSATS